MESYLMVYVFKLVFFPDFGKKYWTQMNKHIAIVCFIVSARPSKVSPCMAKSSFGETWVPMAGAKFGALVSFSMITFKGTRGVSSRNVSALPDVHRSEEWACLEFVAAGYCRLLVDSSAFWLPIGYAKPPFFSTKQTYLFLHTSGGSSNTCHLFNFVTSRVLLAKSRLVPANHHDSWQSMRSAWRDSPMEPPSGLTSPFSLDLDFSFLNDFLQAHSGGFNDRPCSNWWLLHIQGSCVEHSLLSVAFSGRQQPQATWTNSMETSAEFTGNEKEKISNADSTTIACNFFFVWLCQWRPMDDPTRTEATFLQGIKSMAEAATRAAVAAERALERATSALQVVVFMMAFSRVVQKLHLISFRKSLLTVGI